MTSPSSPRWRKIPYVVGLDLSLNGTGIAFISQVGEISLFHLKRKSAPRSASAQVVRLMEIEDALIDMGAFAGEATAVEDYAYGVAQGRQTNCIFQLGELGGVVRLRLHRSRRLWAAVPIKSGKKFATGNGDAEKTQVAEAVAKMWGLHVSNFVSDDTSDALSLASVAAQMAGWPLPGPKLIFRDKLVADLELCKTN